MKRKILKKGLICFLLGFSILNINPLQAKAQSLTNEENDSIKVHVLYNAFDEDYIKNITLDDGTKVGDHDYSITYDLFHPRFYPIADYFDYAAWITRNGVISLSTDPKTLVRWDRSEKDRAWKALSSPTHGFASHSNWKNTQTMQWQFDCHFDKFPGTFKPEWNLEPHRVASSYQQVLDKTCNP